MFQSASLLAGAFGGLFAVRPTSRAFSCYFRQPLLFVFVSGLQYGLLQLDGVNGLKGWQWLFLVCAVLRAGSTSNGLRCNVVWLCS
jgi:hypothetical protein